MITLWPSIARSLDASAATKALALGLILQRIDNQVLHFASRETVTKAAANKLSDALSRHAGQALTIVIQHSASGIRHRCYSDRRNHE